jgi:hypothetical protein
MDLQKGYLFVDQFITDYFILIPILFFIFYFLFLLTIINV